MKHSGNLSGTDSLCKHKRDGLHKRNCKRCFVNRQHERKGAQMVSL